MAMEGRTLIHRDHFVEEEFDALVRNTGDDILNVVSTIRSWKRGFAIWPVRLEEGGWLWMQPMWVREVDRSQPYCPIYRTQYTRFRTRDYD